jgi:pimeloyl-ACP methyl ester carboxylesterase
VSPGLIRQGTINVEGLRSPVIEAGPEDAPEAVVFVHGNPGSRLDWEDLLPRLGDSTRAVAFDMPGFGQADKPEDYDYTVPGYAWFIQAGLEQLGITRVHLVMHDIGGWFGHAWAGAHPGAFASTVIFNTPPASGFRWYLVARAWRTPIVGELLNLTTTRWFFEFNIRRGGGRPVPRAFVDRMWRDFDHATRRCILKLYRSTDARRVQPHPVSTFRALDRPALVVWGRHDPYIPIAFAEEHRKSFPRAAFAFLDRSGHWPFIDDPEGAARAVVPFLDRQVGGRAA